MLHAAQRHRVLHCVLPPAHARAAAPLGSTAAPPLFAPFAVKGKSKVYFSANASAILPSEFVNGLEMPEGSLDALTEAQLGARGGGARGAPAAALGGQPACLSATAILGPARSLPVPFLPGS